jgi:hypothetical protein
MTDEGAAERAHQLSTFLDKERRQVWALHQDTLTPFYLPEGQADELRNFTKANLRCTHPDCTVAISTRGGTKRDHFFHVRTANHETGRESEFHLAGKAMIALWASTRVPTGAVVVEERTVKDANRRISRRADVMVTGATGRQVAFEVEYKSFAVEAWRAKQDDYDDQGIACAWLLGHTKVRLAPTASHLAGLGETAVRMPALATEIARAGYPLVVINPATRQVGTLADNPDFTRRFQGSDVHAWMAIDDLDDCEFSPRGGIVTPTLRRIAAAEQRTAQERAALAAAAERANAAARAKQERIAELERAQLRVWEASALHAKFLDRWGRVPEVLGRDAGQSWGVWAAVPHWHSVLYEELLHDRTATFTWADVFAALDRHSIRRHHDSRAAYRAITRWLEFIERVGLVRIRRGAKGRVVEFTATAITMSSATAALAHGTMKARLASQQSEAVSRRHPAQEQLERLDREADLDPRRRTRLVVAEDGTRRWVPKDLI